MANSAQARKRARQADKRRVRNKGQRSMMRHMLIRCDQAIESGDRAVAEAAYTALTPVLDRMAGKGLIHRNKAARHKSRMGARIVAM